MEPAYTAAQFPLNAIPILQDTFHAAELFEGVGVPDKTELPLAHVASFCHLDEPHKIKPQPEPLSAVRFSSVTQRLAPCPTVARFAVNPNRICRPPQEQANRQPRGLASFARCAARLISSAMRF